MSGIKRALRPIRMRIRLIRMVQGMAWGSAAGAGVCLAVMAASFFLPLRWKLPLCGLALAAGLLLGGLINALRPVRAGTAARLGDAHGLQERIQTALAVKDDSPMAQMQKTDTLQALRGFDPRAVPLPSTGRTWLAAGIAVLLCGGLLLIPNPQNKVIEQAAAFEEQMEKATRQAEEMAWREDPALTKKERQEARKLMSELSRELREAREPMDAMLAVSNAEKRLEALRDTMAGEALARMNSALQSNGLETLAQAMESGDAEAMHAALENTDAKAVENAANALSGEMQELLNAISQALQNGDLTAAVGMLSQMPSAAQMSAASQLSSLSQMLSGMRGNGAASLALGNGGLGLAGSGAGTGTTNEDQTADKEETPGVRGNRNPYYRESEYESIYDPTRLDAGQMDLSAQSQRQEGDSVQVQLGPGAGALQGNIPYNEVALEYAQAAAQAADSQNLSMQERQWVNDYFTALTEE